VFGVEKLVSSKMLVEGSGKRIFHIGKHAAICVAGLQADARQLVLRGEAFENDSIFLLLFFFLFLFFFLNSLCLCSSF
jgi:20S proteasome alpha/beta subunit